MSVMMLTSDSFEEKIKASEKCLVDFFALWCGPCSMLSPVVENLSEELDGVDFFKVDVDECPELAAKFGVDRIPYLVLFKNGEPTASYTGFIPGDRLREFVEQA